MMVLSLLLIFFMPQVIPGNDQIPVLANQGTAGSRLERIAQLMFYGSRGHLKSFSGVFLGRCESIY